ncbi:hypothetical protein [Bacillus sp. V3-13]|nr:hypothetical protein [Bacillus sp. V3-13]
MKRKRNQWNKENDATINSPGDKVEKHPEISLNGTVLNPHNK